MSRRMVDHLKVAQKQAMWARANALDARMGLYPGDPRHRRISAGVERLNEAINDLTYVLHLGIRELRAETSNHKGVQQGETIHARVGPGTPAGLM